MISEEREERRGLRPLVWPALVSLFAHGTALPVLGWLWMRDLTSPITQTPAPETVVASTAVRIERRAVPHPRTLPPQVTTPHREPVPPAQPHPLQPRTALHELARLVPAAPPQPPPRPSAAPKLPTLAERLRDQQASFQAVTAQLNQQNEHPLSFAKPAPEAAKAYHRSMFDITGVHEDPGSIKTVLTPLRQWSENGLSCHYASYIAQFPNGTTEDGEVPWPICYPPSHDPMADDQPFQEVGIPAPPAGYVLPSGTYLTPLLRTFYDTRPPP